MGKDKRLTRKEHETLVPAPKLIEYEMRKAMQAIRARHYPISEMQDEWAVGEATQVHHIFPKSTHPELAAVKENLILLTATQHFTKAHPGNKTSRINKSYQVKCLMSKIRTISADSGSDLFYSEAAMKEVLSVGMGFHVAPDESLELILQKLSAYVD